MQPYSVCCLLYAREINFVKNALLKIGLRIKGIQTCFAGMETKGQGLLGGEAVLAYLTLHQG